MIFKINSNLKLSKSGKRYRIYVRINKHDLNFESFTLSKTNCKKLIKILYLLI